MVKVTIQTQDYFEIIYPDGLDTDFSKQPCPNCGKAECWDLVDNEHKGITDSIFFECGNCNAKWTEHWAMKKVTLEIPEENNEEVPNC